MQRANIHHLATYNGGNTSRNNVSEMLKETLHPGPMNKCSVSGRITPGTDMRPLPSNVRRFKGNDNSEPISRNSGSNKSGKVLCANVSK
jgi:hypothetical protein